MTESTPPQSSLILYQTEDGRTRVQCRFEGETLWLSQALMAELFQVTAPTVNEHLKGTSSRDGCTTLSLCPFAHLAPTILPKRGGLDATESGW